MTEKLDKRVEDLEDSQIKIMIENREHAKKLEDHEERIKEVERR